MLSNFYLYNISEVNNMEFEDLIKQRHSIRKYTQKQVSDEQILKILEVGRLSQSARNRQPWFFATIKGKNKDALVSKLLEKDQTLEQNPTARMFKECSVLILILTTKEGYESFNDVISLGCLIENMCLEITNLGLSTCWNRNIANKEDIVLQHINKQEYRLATALPVGYPNEYVEPRPRKALEELYIYKD